MIVAAEKQRLDKKKLLTNHAQKSIFQSLLAGLRLKEAAEKAGVAHGTACNVVSKCEIRALVEQERRDIERKTAEELEETTAKSIETSGGIHLGASQKPLPCFEMFLKPKAVPDQKLSS